MPFSTVEYDPINFGLELQEQLASSNRSVGFLLGAGTSMAAGLPDLKKLTDDVAAGLSPGENARFNELRGGTGNLETVLNRTRALREILGSTDTLWGLTQNAALELDRSICRIVYDLISGGNLKPTNAHVALAHWTQQSQRTSTVEFFTTNYDLLFESAFETIGLPFFDGFVGSVQPFFVPQAVDPTTTSDFQLNTLPSTWARLWKLHGSIGWRFIEDPITKNKKIIRVSGTKPVGGDEVVIYPSRDKYSESRRLPYLTYMDRFRRFLAAGERLLLVNGYSFGDEHLNEVLRQGLQSNSRLAIHAFFFGDIAEEAKRTAVYHPNLSAMGRKEAIIGAAVGTWRKPAAKPKPGEKWHCWDDANGEFVLGNFSSFGEFLGAMVGPQSTTPSPPSKP